MSSRFPDGDFIDDGQQVLVARLLHFFGIWFMAAACRGANAEDERVVN
ncbi:MAG: hypothetical protein ACLSUW_07735 [Akkermansia sp.]